MISADERREPMLFSAVLRPNRSLSAGSFLTLMLSFLGVSLAAGIVFARLGAWPILGFFVIELAMLWRAFRVNYRDAHAYEVVTVTRSELTLNQVNPRGSSRMWTLNPLWVRLDRERIEEYGTDKLFVVSHGRRYSIANVLGPFEKDSFADALSAALADARGGPPYRG